MKGNTIVSAGQAWGPSPSLVSRKPAGEGQPFLTLESYLSSPTYAVTIWDRTAWPDLTSWTYDLQP